MPKVSFTPDTYQEGGGLWDNIDVKWTNAHFVSNWDYGGKMNPVPALVIDLVNQENDEVFVQAWSVGSAKDYAASEDGKKPAETGNYLLGPQLRKSSNVVILFESLIDALPDDGKDDLITRLLASEPDGSGVASALNDLVVHMIRKKIERPGLKKAPRADGREYDSTVPVVDTILKFPWDKQKAKAPPGAAKVAAPVGTAKGAVAAAPKAAPKASGTVDIDAKVIGYVKTVLENPVFMTDPEFAEGITRTKMSQEVFKLEKDPKSRTTVVQKVFSADWLEEKAEEGGWTFDRDSDRVSAA